MCFIWEAAAAMKLNNAEKEIHTVQLEETDSSAAVAEYWKQ